ncbi:MAG: hypothetical protein M1827_000144 [Pycnora praestabilis]|nr:MAG: hypothetical protein M1827_000144 [Pycnora praestabilis]
MAFPMIDTPHTEAGNATHLTHAGDFDFSMENSFQSPSKDNNDLIKQMQNSRKGINLKTPRSRAPFGDRRNLLAPPAHGEFTPLLKSVTKSNLLRQQSNGKENGIPHTPAFLKPGYKNADSPALPAESSGIYGGDNTGSSFEGEDGESTPVPQVASSSAASTPLAMLPRRDGGGGVLTDGANVMTLREQEQTINKIEKENFGLKLKIHFLEENLKKLAPGYNQAALRENTELKIDKVTMQKELRQYRKTLGTAEHELEMYRQQVMEIQEKVKRKHLDEGQREEIERLKRDLEAKEKEVEDLRAKLESAEAHDDEVEKLRDELGDLEAEQRAKDRIIEQKDDEIDELVEKVNKESSVAAELEQQLETAQEHVHELESTVSKSEDQEQALERARNDLADARDRAQELEDRFEQAQAEVKESREEKIEAMDERQQAVEDLNELRDEMANKSFSTKGLSRQLEEKANKLQDDLEILRHEHANLQEKYDDKSHLAEILEEKVQELEQDIEEREQNLKDDLELAQHERDVAVRERTTLAAQLQQSRVELEDKSEEKDLLQSRHDALTIESQSLQRELSRKESLIQELEGSWTKEKQLALDNDRALRDESREEVARLHTEIDSLRHEVQERERQSDADQDNWDSQRRNLEVQGEKAAEQAAGLKRTIDKLRETEGTLSGREMKLQEALQSENERHQREEAVLNRQIQELNADIDGRRQTLDGLRDELAAAKEELRVSKRQENSLDEKVQSLEDEIDILQVSLDEESDKARNDITAARQEAEGLKRQLYSLKQDLARIESAHADAKAEVEAFQGDLQAGQGSKEQLDERVREIETHLQKVRREKQALQDQLANINIEMHNLRTSVAEVEAERDELSSQIKQKQDQVDGTLRLDQEKVDLRKAKLKLESEVGRLREERKGLLENSEATEKELEEEIERASAEEARLQTEVMDLRKRLAVASESRDKELIFAKRNVQRLEIRIEELVEQKQQGNTDGDAAAEMSMIRKDLSDARRKETEYLQREASSKENARDLKHRIADLERNLHEIEISKLVVDSPRSSIGGSTRKNEVIEVRRQLAEAHQQMKELRSRLKENEREAQRRSAAADRDYQTKTDASEREREMLEQALSDSRLQQEDLLNKNSIAEQTIDRVRNRIHHLEKELHTARLDRNDHTIAEERKDLHEMLKDAKLEVEDLQMQIAERETRVEAATWRESDLRAQLKRVREERSLQAQKATAAATELESLQYRYEHTIDKMARLQQSWDEERKTQTQRVRFPNTTISSLHRSDSTEMLQLEQEIKQKEKQHNGEIMGLAKQIQYLRARCRREEGFRADLAYSKKFFLMQIELYSACNHADLQMIEEMGITPDRSIRDKRPSLRSVGWMVLASVRMKKMQGEWASNRRIHATLARKVEQTKRQSRKVIHV